LLRGEELDSLLREIARRYPKAQVRAISARSGEGVAEWLDAIQDESNNGTIGRGRKSMEVDYDLYADGEALLGWLNITMKVSGEEFDGNEFLMHLLREVQQRAATDWEGGLRIAHLKATLTPSQGNDVGVANLVRDDYTVEQSHRLVGPLEEGILVLNFRAEGDPEQMRNVAEASLHRHLSQLRLTGEIVVCEAFRPSRPNPTHRLAELDSV
ncbi:MAG: cobalamin biosynthesis protein P47K, partial [Planctomycetota bacterium]